MDYDIDELKTIVAPIAKKYKVERMSLFGSRARGDNTAESDYDFCIIPDKKMSLIKLSGFRLELIDALHTDVDVVCEDALKPEFLEFISKDRMVLYEV